MMFPHVNPQVSLLFRPVGTIRALKHGLLPTALDLFVPPHRRLPSVPLSAMPTSKLRVATITRSNALTADGVKLPQGPRDLIAGFQPSGSAKEGAEGGVAFQIAL